MVVLPNPKDDEVTLEAMHKVGMALYIESTLPHDSGEDIVVHPPHPKEMTLAHCTGYAMFSPCWLEGAFQTMNTLPAGPGPTLKADL